MKEIIQVLTDGYGYETLCTVNKDNNMFLTNQGCTRKALDVLHALHKTYPEDTFRVLSISRNTDEEGYTVYRYGTLRKEDDDGN